MTNPKTHSFLNRAGDPERIQLGRCDLPSGKINEGDPLQLKPQTLLRHMMALGSSGSGKTVLSKVVVEEMCRLGLPAICIDPQGDICSLARALNHEEVSELESRGINPELAKQFRDRVEVVIFTPASRKGVPLCADPMYIDVTQLNERDRITSVSSIAAMITSLIGYDLSSDDGEGISAAFDVFLNHLHEHGSAPQSLEEFSAALSAIDEDVRLQLERFVNPKKLDQALRKLARLDVGSRRLLFHEGLPLNIDLLYGRGPASASTKGKTRLSVIYLNTLNSPEDKEFIIATLAEQLYAWMLKNPSKAPQSLFYIDEVAPFIPPVRVPACKPPLSLIFKQARKYGVCCLMATQNPGDVDYKAMAQFGTWAIGRLTTRQDQKKIQPTINALDPDKADDLMATLPTLQAGEFLLLSPDEFSETVKLKTRWLYTRHDTLDDRAIETLYNERWRTRFEALEGTSHPSSSNKTDRSVSGEDQANKSDEHHHTNSLPHQAPASPSSKETNRSEPQSKPRSVAKPSTDQLPTPSAQSRSPLELAMISALETGEALSATELGERIGCSRQRAARLLKSAVEEGELAFYERGRSKLYYLLASGARPDLDLPDMVPALMPKMTREEIEARIEDQRQKSFLGLIGRDEELHSRRLVYRVIYQVKFREDVPRTGFSALFSSKHEEMEDYIYLDPGTLKILVYKPGEPITLEEKPAEYACQIDDFDGVSELTTLSPGSVSLEEDSWSQRIAHDEVKDTITSRYPAVKISSVNPVFLPLWLLRYQDRGGHQVRRIHIDALTGRPVQFDE